MQKTVRLLLIAQLSLLTALLVCTALLPHFLFESNEGGISNFGTFAKTIVPFTFGFGICGICTLVAAMQLPKTVTQHRKLQRALMTLGSLYLLVLFSTYPYKLNNTFDAIHNDAGLLLILSFVLIGSWLALQLVRNRGNLLLLCALYVGFALCVLNYFGFEHTLFVDEILATASFGALLIKSVSAL